jgi:methylated-DNA-[protein]-cysteine S-methyltransferase
MKSMTWHTTTPSTLGELTLVRDADGIRGLYFPRHWYLPDEAIFGPSAGDGFDETISQLGEYLAGVRREFDLPLAPRGDVFQRRVWNLVAQIPYGDTVTYGELAARLGGAATAQQIGAAVGRNPLSIFIGCHRVLGRGGKLTGYAGGVARKRHLLELERN